MVVAFRSKENTITLTASDATTIKGRERSSEAAVPPITTGRSGNMHGARMVKTPAKKAVPKSNKSIKFS